MVETLSAEQIMNHYVEAYQKLYNRKPKDMRPLENGWIIVNGARMRVTELALLTAQLQLEYKQGIEERRGMVNRLLSWFKKH
jgi:hypothetical protein